MEMKVENHSKVPASENRILVQNGKLIKKSFHQNSNKFHQHALGVLEYTFDNDKNYKTHHAF